MTYVLPRDMVLAVLKQLRDHDTLLSLMPGLRRWILEEHFKWKANYHRSACNTHYINLGRRGEPAGVCELLLSYEPPSITFFRGGHLKWNCHEVGGWWLRDSYHPFFEHSQWPVGDPGQATFYDSVDD